MSEDEGYEGYDWSDASGPFCRHWGDPVDCDVPCKTCGHHCTRHGLGDQESECSEEGCKCAAWVNP